MGQQVSMPNDSTAFTVSSMHSESKSTLSSTSASRAPSPTSSCMSFEYLELADIPTDAVEGSLSPLTMSRDISNLSQESFDVISTNHSPRLICTPSPSSAHPLAPSPFQMIIAPSEVVQEVVNEDLISSHSNWNWEHDLIRNDESQWNRFLTEYDQFDNRCPSIDHHQRKGKDSRQTKKAVRLVLNQRYKDVKAESKQINSTNPVMKAFASHCSPNGHAIQIKSKSKPPQSQTQSIESNNNQTPKSSQIRRNETRLMNHTQKKCSASSHPIYANHFSNRSALSRKKMTLPLLIETMNLNTFQNKPIALKSSKETLQNYSYPSNSVAILSKLKQTKRKYFQIWNRGYKCPRPLPFEININYIQRFQNSFYYMFREIIEQTFQRANMNVLSLSNYKVSMHCNWVGEHAWFRFMLILLKSLNNHLPNQGQTALNLRFVQPLSCMLHKDRSVTDVAPNQATSLSDFEHVVRGNPSYCEFESENHSSEVCKNFCELGLPGQVSRLTKGMRSYRPDQINHLIAWGRGPQIQSITSAIEMEIKQTHFVNKGKNPVYKPKPRLEKKLTRSMIICAQIGERIPSIYDEYYPQFYSHETLSLNASNLLPCIQVEYEIIKPKQECNVRMELKSIKAELDRAKALSKKHSDSNHIDSNHVRLESKGRKYDSLDCERSIIYSNPTAFLHADTGQWMSLLSSATDDCYSRESLSFNELYGKRFETCNVTSCCRCFKCFPPGVERDEIMEPYETAKADGVHPFKLHQMLACTNPHCYHHTGEDFVWPKKMKKAMYQQVY